MRRPLSQQYLLRQPPTQLPKYFTEEWEGKTTDWRWFSTHGDDNLWDVYNEAGVLVFYLTGKDTYAYFIYNPWDYEKVQVSTQIEIRSKTKSATVIVCDYSDTIGWYEFNIGSDGLWEIRAHDTLGHTGYVSLISGGSKLGENQPAIDTIIRFSFKHPISPLSCCVLQKTYMLLT